MASRGTAASLAMALLLLLATIGVSRGQLQVGFYSDSCPDAVGTVTAAVQDAAGSDPTILPALPRLQSDGSFVRGHDAVSSDDHLLGLEPPSYKMETLHKFSPDDLFLYAVTNSAMNNKWGRSIKDAVKAAIEGGATIVQLREKDADTREFLEAAKACVEICRSAGVPLVINDRVDVALACDADGVHVGQSDMPASEARKLLGPGKIVGVTCRTAAEAEQAWRDGADYIGCGGVFPTTTKASNPTVGFEGLRAVCSAAKLPVVAIGGINAGNAGSVMELGLPNLKGVAVVSALFDKECVAAETRSLRSILMNASCRS